MLLTWNLLITNMFFQTDYNFWAAGFLCYFFFSCNREREMSSLAFSFAWKLLNVNFDSIYCLLFGFISVGQEVSYIPVFSLAWQNTSRCPIIGCPDWVSLQQDVHYYKGYYRLSWVPLINCPLSATLCSLCFFVTYTSN